MSKKLVVAISSIAFCASVLAEGIKSDASKAKEKAQRPSQEQVTALQTLNLRIENMDGDLHFTWSPATGGDCGGVKIAYSDTHAEPLYPYDPYIAWLPGTNLSSYVVRNAQAASKNERYYRVCAVRPNDHKSYTALSNSVKVSPVEATESTMKYLEKKQAEKTLEHKSKDISKADKFNKDASTGVAKKVEAGNVIICSQCGRKCGAEDRFCSQCGAKLEKP